MLCQVLLAEEHSNIILAKYTTNNKYYAIKIYNKLDVVESDLVDNIMNEITTMKSFSNNDNLVNLKFCFTSETHIYIGMDFLQGGNLSTKLSKDKILDEEDAKRYAAQILKGLQAIHSQNRIYRALEPKHV